MSTRPVSPSPEVYEAPASDRPEFLIAMRGYDRAQVDDYVARLSAWGAEEQARTQEAERALATYAARIDELENRIQALNAAASPSAQVEAAAARAADAVESALAEAEAIRNRARAEADAALAAARQQAVETVRSAQQSIAELERLADADRRRAGEALDTSRQAAQEEADALLAETQRICAANMERDEQRRQAAEAVLRDLGKQRDVVVGHLDRLRGAIESMVGGPGPDEEGEGPAGPGEPGEPAKPASRHRDPA